jgi:hypothetical protein
MEPGIGFLPRPIKMIIKGRVYRLAYLDDENMPFPHVIKLYPQPLVLALEDEIILSGNEYLAGKVSVKILYKGKVMRVPVWHLYDPYEGGLGE